jgi:two-component system, OmpR family, response regulator
MKAAFMLLSSNPPYRGAMTGGGGRVLVAEDDHRLRALLEQVLAEAGWEVTAVGDGRQAHLLARDGRDHDVLLLDIGLPGMDGITICRRLRDDGVVTPVLMLTAKGQVADRITGLDSGADDYLPKPFDIDELLARLRALRRREELTAARTIEVGDLRIEPAARRVSRGGTPVELTAREFDLLHLLAARAGQVVTRFDILDAVWDGETDLRSNVIDVHLASVRAKVDRPFGTDSITTLRGVGYRLEAG